MTATKAKNHIVNRLIKAILLIGNRFRRSRSIQKLDELIGVYKRKLLEKWGYVGMNHFLLRPKEIGVLDEIILYLGWFKKSVKLF